MKGLICAGGTATRLEELTRVTNKHLLPIYDKPMVYYPIQTLVNAGIEEILLVTGGKNAGDFLRLLGNGRDFGLKHLNYTYQEGEGGIAEALGLAEYFAGGKPIFQRGERRIVAALEPYQAGDAGFRNRLRAFPSARERQVDRFFAEDRFPRRRGAVPRGPMSLQNRQIMFIGRVALADRATKIGNSLA